MTTSTSTSTDQIRGRVEALLYSWGSGGDELDLLTSHAMRHPDWLVSFARSLGQRAPGGVAAATDLANLIGQPR